MKKHLQIILTISLIILNSCNKDNETTDPPPTGQVCFYHLKTSVCDTLLVECEGQKGIVTKKYAFDDLNCGADSTFTITLGIGKHKFKYSSKNGSYNDEGEILVSKDGCNKMALAFYLNRKIDLGGLWVLDFELDPIGNCDETDLEDEANLPSVINFKADGFKDEGIVEFDYNAVEDLKDLNNPDIYTNTYRIVKDTLYITTYFDYKGTGYSEQGKNELRLVYDIYDQKFKGTCAYKYWYNGILDVVCNFPVTIYRK